RRDPARAASLHARRRGGRGDAARPPGGGSRALKSARGVTERPPCANLRPNESRGAHAGVAPPDSISGPARTLRRRATTPIGAAIRARGAAMETATVESKPLQIVREPRVYLVGRQVTDEKTLARFLADEGVSWQTDSEVGAERLAEVAGRVCYMSYGKGRKTNREFIGHLIEVGHGSVLEHGVWSFLVTGVSRSFTHELIRHRHFSYSQLSQRYVDESDSDFVEPDVIASDPALHAEWVGAVESARRAYDRLVAGLQERFSDVPDKTLRRKLARQAARSVLP